MRAMLPGAVGLCGVLRCLKLRRLMAVSECRKNRRGSKRNAAVAHLGVAPVTDALEKLPSMEDAARRARDFRNGQPFCQTRHALAKAASIPDRPTTMKCDSHPLAGEGFTAARLAQRTHHRVAANTTHSQCLQQEDVSAGPVQHQDSGYRTGCSLPPGRSATWLAPSATCCRYRSTDPAAAKMRCTMSASAAKGSVVCRSAAY